MKRRIVTLLALDIIAKSVLSPSFALEAPVPGGGQALADVVVLSDGELADLRGGFFTAAGAQFDFGASISTTVNGQLALQTNVNWTQAGVSVQQSSGLGASIQSQVNTQVASNLAKAGIADPVTASSAASGPATTTTPSAAVASASAPPTSLAAIATAAASSTASTQVPVPAAVTAAIAALMPAATTPTTAVTAQAVVPAAGNTTIAATVPSVTARPTTVATITNILPTNSSGNGASSTTPALLSGVQLQGASGSTQVLANVSAGQLQNILINSASNQDITQNTNVVFTIYNFADWQKQLTQNAISAQLVGELRAAAGLGGSR